MAALRPDQAKTGAADAMIGTPETRVTPRPGRYEIDTSCSAVTFQTRHLFGLAPVRGSFAIRAGTVDVAESLADSSIYVRFDSASFRTGNRQRDDSVCPERLLDTARYPAITFRSKGVDGPALTGALTVRNVTRPVTLSIERTAVTPGSFNAKASTRIDRTEFGATAYRGVAGRYLDMTIEVRCVRT
jgi:polyisoprenoid-binding protein YceI